MSKLCNQLESSMILKLSISKISYLTWFFLLFSFFSESKACTQTENHEYGLENNFKKSIVSQYIVFNETETKKILYNLVEENKDCFTFGTEEDNQASFDKWGLYSRSLYTLFLMGDENCKSDLINEFEARNHRLKSIDFYVDEDNYDLYLFGIWSQVAIYDKKEREKLICKAKTDINFPKNQKIINVLKNYDFTFRGI